MQSQASISGNRRLADAPLPETEDAVSMIMYRSRAVKIPSEQDLELLLDKAQQRNRSESLTGLLIYDHGNFFQWLEGPSAGLARVWDSISRDPRHRDPQILRAQSIPKRFFGTWDMRLALRSVYTDDSGFEIVSAHRELRGAHSSSAPLLSQNEWERIFADAVLPELRAAHLPTPKPVALIWHAPAEVPGILAGISLAPDAGATARYLNELVEQGASLETLYGEVFEPAARHLGGLWYEDLTSDAEVTLGLSRLQVEARRLSAALAHPLHVIRPGHAVLVAPQPGEIHGLTAAMSSELFWRDGWDVSCEYPSSDGMLRELVHDNWFDVLNLSSSDALRRRERLPAMAMSIRSAQAASQNPALAVIVNGRVFFERPQAYSELGADASSMTVVDGVSAAQRLLDTLATQRRIEQTLMDPPRAERSRPLGRSRR